MAIHLDFCDLEPLCHWGLRAVFRNGYSTRQGWRRGVGRARRSLQHGGGQLQNKIAGLAEGCLLSPPTVVTGSDYSLHSLAEPPGLEIRQLFERMPIAITLQIHS